MRTWFALAALFVGCTDGDPFGNDDDSDADTDADSDADTDADTDVDTFGDPDETLSGDLSDGTQISLAWADDSGIFCWPGNENTNFTGSHVFFEVDKEGMDEIWVRAAPGNDVDVSLYTLEFPAGSTQYPPNITSASRCEAKFDQAGDSNPGVAELIGPLYGFPDRELLIGVAGANEQTSGAFTVEIWKRDTNGFDTGQ